MIEDQDPTPEQGDGPSPEQGQGIDLNEQLKKQIEANKRIADESKTWKSKFQDIKSHVDKLQEEKLQNEGKIQELLEMEKKRNQELLEEIRTERTQTVNQKLRTLVRELAPDAHNIDRVLSVVEHKDLLKLDPETKTVEGVAEFIAKVRETDPYLFSKGKLAETTPKKGEFAETKKGLGELSRSERESLKAQLFKEKFSK